MAPTPGMSPSKAAKPGFGPDPTPTMGGRGEAWTRAARHDSQTAIPRTSRLHESQSARPQSPQKATESVSGWLAHFIVMNSFRARPGVPRNQSGQDSAVGTIPETPFRGPARAGLVDSIPSSPLMGAGTSVPHVVVPVPCPAGSAARGAV